MGNGWSSASDPYQSSPAGPEGQPERDLVTSVALTCVSETPVHLSLVSASISSVDDSLVVSKSLSLSSLEIVSSNAISLDSEWVLVSATPSSLTSNSFVSRNGSKQPLAERAHATTVLSCDPSSGPAVQGKLYRGRDTKEWAYYRDNWTNGFGFAMSGGGSRSCTSAWGVLNSLHSGNRSKFLTFAYMSSNSGGSWCLQPLLYMAQPSQNGSNGALPVRSGQGYDVGAILGVYRASSLLTIADLTSNIRENPALAGYGTLMIKEDDAGEWWDSLDSYFSIPHDLGQSYSNNEEYTKWQLCTFGQSDQEILEELNMDENELSDCFKTSARTMHEGYPLPIAVGCAWKYESYFSEGCLVYPVEFTPSCSGVFRDCNSNPPKDTFGNDAYPDYLVTNALFGTDLSLVSEKEQTVSAPMKRLTTFPQWNNQKPYRGNSLGVNEFMAISSDAAAVEAQESFCLSTVTAPSSQGVVETSTYNYLDGGVCCNTGLMSLLQRRLSHITVCIANSIHYFDDSKTTINEISDISRYFGESRDCFEDYEFSVYHQVGTMPQIAACFGSEPISGIRELYRRLQFNWQTYGTAVAMMSHPLKPTQVCQDFYGLSGPMYANYSPFVSWYLVQRPQASSLEKPTVRNAPFWASLNSEVLEQYMKLVPLTGDSQPRGDFPYFDTQNMLQLESLEANAMKYYTSSTSDYYLLPHLRKNNAPSHYWIDDTKTQYASIDYFQLEDKECKWSVGSFPSSKKEPIVSIFYSPLLLTPVFVYASHIEYNDIISGGMSKNSPSSSSSSFSAVTKNVQIKCALHTPCGIFIGGSVLLEKKESVAFLGLYLYTKCEDDSGVIHFEIGDFVPILPFSPCTNVPFEMKQLTSINSLLETASATNENDAYFSSTTTATISTFPQIVLLGDGAAKKELCLCWKIAVAPNPMSSIGVSFAFNSANILSSSSSLLTKKICLINNNKEIVWLQDQNTVDGASSMTIQIIEEGRSSQNIVDPSVKSIFDIAHCPLLNGVLIFCVQTPFIVNNSSSSSSPSSPQQTLKVQLSQYDNRERKVISQIVSVSYEENAIVVDATTVISAEYQGNVFVIRIGSEVYLLQDLTLENGLVLCKLQNLPTKERNSPFVPSFMS